MDVNPVPFLALECRLFHFRFLLTCCPFKFEVQHAGWWWLTDRLHQDVAERSGDVDSKSKTKIWPIPSPDPRRTSADDEGKRRIGGAIARRLGRAPSTISRELIRNASQCDYDFEQADRLATERRSAASAQPRDPGAAERSHQSLSRYCVTSARVIASPRPESFRMFSSDIAEKSVG